MLKISLRFLLHFADLLGISLTTLWGSGATTWKPLQLNGIVTGASKTDTSSSSTFLRVYRTYACVVLHWYDCIPTDTIAKAPGRPGIDAFLMHCVSLNKYIYIIESTDKQLVAELR